MGGWVEADAARRGPINGRVPGSVLLVLLNRALYGLGGEEKRYSRLWAYLERIGEAPHNRLHLLVNQEHLERVRKAGIDIPDNDRLIVVHNWDKGGYDAKVEVAKHLLGTVAGMPPPVVVHFVSAGLAFAPMLLPFRLTGRCRIVVSIVTPSVSELRKHVTTYTVVRLAAAVADYVETLNETTDLPKYVRPTKIRVSPGSFSDPEVYRPGPKRVGSVSFVGHLTEHKGALLFAHAVVQVAQTIGNLDVSVVGDGPIRSEVESILRREPSIHVRWFGPSFHPEVVLAESDIFCSLQLKENYPSQSLLEAMLTENAIVATEVGETRKLIDEQVGQLVTPEVDRVAAGIIRLLSLSPEVRRQMGRAARQRVLMTHSVEAYWGFLKTVYEEALAMSTKATRISLPFGFL